MWSVPAAEGAALVSLLVAFDAVEAVFEAMAGAWAT